MFGISCFSLKNNRFRERFARFRLFILFSGLLFFPASSRAQFERVQEYYRTAAQAAGEESFQLTFIQPDMRLVKNYDSLLQIILIRHGEPALKKHGWMKRPSAEAFIRAYDDAGVYPFEQSPLLLRDTDPDTVLTSSLRRAQHTARLAFGEEVRYRSDSIFREFERKILAFPSLRMPLRFWLLSSRVLWLLGTNDQGVESFREAKERTARAAQKLETRAKRHKKAVLVAHGFLNRYLRKALQKRGWTLVYDGGHEYLSTVLLVRYR